jgi:hypothetical protein
MWVCRVSMMSLIVSEFDEIISAAGLSTDGDDRGRLVCRGLGGSRVSFCVFRADNIKEETCELQTRIEAGT